MDTVTVVGEEENWRSQGEYVAASRLLTFDEVRGVLQRTQIVII
jgi:hypothetical protein